MTLHRIVSVVDRVPAAARRLATRRPRDRWGKLCRDVASVSAALRDDVPPPFRYRVGTAWRRRGLSPRTLVVDEIRAASRSARRLRLVDPLGAPIPFRPGQFLTLLVEVDGSLHRRAYSICSSPSSPGVVELGVKKVPGGRVSTHLVERLAPGTRLEVLGPSGRYGLEPEPRAARHVVLIAAGSGITPQLSILLGVVDQEPGSRVTLLYGNRELDEVMFRDQLDRLRAKHPERLRVRHLLTRPPPGWEGGIGRLDATNTAAELDRLGLEHGEEVLWFLCGPEGMMQAVHGLLRDRGVPSSAIHLERFTAAPRDVKGIDQPVEARFRCGDRSWHVEVQPGQTVLEAGLSAGVDLAYSCGMGGCGACRVRLEAGRVELEEPNCLTDEERREAYVLACVAHPAEPVEVVA